MKIAIDISQIQYEGSGVARFTNEFTQAILAAERKHEWVFFYSSLRNSLDKDIEKAIKQKGFILTRLRFPVNTLSLLWNDLHVVRIENFVGKVDWFISSDWSEPPTSRAKKATIVHDLVYLRYPHTAPRLIKKTQAKRLAWVKKESSVVFADSYSTKQDLMTYLNVKEDKIAVIYPGVAMAPEQMDVENVLQKYNLKKGSFILTVGKIEPRKNIQRLVDAYVRVKPKGITLAIVGPTGWGNVWSEWMKSEEVMQRQRLDPSFGDYIKKNVQFLGFVKDEDLKALYSSCAFFIYPSLWEGFGYPVVEAMRCGAPVATSTTSSLAEIGKGAAVLFNPTSVEEIGEAIQGLLSDQNLRNSLSKKGFEASQQFTWSNYYKQFINILESNS